jgi:hypothetical protein
MEEIGKKSIEELRRIENRLFQAINTSSSLFGKNMFSRSIAFPQYKNMMNSALFEVWTAQLGRLNSLQIRNLETNRAKLLEGYKLLFQEERFDSSVTRSTSDKVSVQERFSKIEVLINQFI